MLFYTDLQEDKKDCHEEGCCWSTKRVADAAFIGALLWISTGTNLS